MSTKKENEEISVHEFVDNLLLTGELVNCDDTNPFFANSSEIPKYYNKNLFKVGQKFFNKYLYAWTVSAFFGLAAGYAVPTISNIVRNDSPAKCYKRQIMTLLFLEAWISSDLKPGSKKSQSIVKSMHNSASKGNVRAGSYSINQKDMALSQFIFVGFALTRPKHVGIHYATVEEWRGFHHFWRVMGCLLGIEERFNICRFSLERTTEICELLISRVFRPFINTRDPYFLLYFENLCDGASAIIPELTPKWSINYLHNLVQEKCTDIKISKPSYIKVNIFWNVFYNFYALFMIYFMRFKIVNFVNNCLLLCFVLLAKYFPIIAFFKFGPLNSYTKTNVL